MILRPHGAGQRGQALVEFALAASIALTLIFGIIDFGRALYAYDLVAQVARVGTRYAIVHATISPHNCSDTTVGTTPCETDVAAFIKSKMTGVDPSQISVKTPFTWEGADTTCTATASPGCTVGIEVDYNFTFVALPLPAQTIKSYSQMLISQ